MQQADISIPTLSAFTDLKVSTGLSSAQQLAEHSF